MSASSRSGWRYVARPSSAGAPSATVLEFAENRRVVSDWALLRKKALAWLLAVRLPFLTASVTPVVLGGTIAWATRDTLSWGLLWLTIAAGAFIHLGVNVINDYFDHASANDDLNTDFVRPFSGGSRVIQMGLLTPLEMLVGAIVLCGLSSAIGIYLAMAAGAWVLAFGVVGLISGVFYVGNPINWGSRGIGELMVGLNFGILMTLGSYYVQTGRIDWAPGDCRYPGGGPHRRRPLRQRVPRLRRRQGRRQEDVGRPLGAPAGRLGLLLAHGDSLRGGGFRGGRRRPAFAGPAGLAHPAPGRPGHPRRPSLSLAASASSLPANALTIVIHLATGLLLTLGYVWDGSGLRGIGYLIGLALLFALIVAFVTRGIEQEKQAFLAARQALSAGQG